MSRAFIAFYMGDYDRDTRHLSTLEHGAYFLLLKHCWVHGSIPVENSSRALIAQLSEQKWRTIRGKVNPFFDSEGRNKRATKEIEKAEKLSTRQAMAGHRGARKRWGNHSHGVATANSHGHGSSDGHGMAIKKEDITTNLSVAARVRAERDSFHTNSTPETAGLPDGFAEEARRAVQQNTGTSYLVEALTRKAR
jgi:uncharacterized protein YdaU (DUF1376 family)